MAVAREAEVDGETAEILLSAAQRFDCGAQPQARQVPVNRFTGFLTEHAAKMEGTRLQLPCQVRQVDRLPEGPSQQAPEVLGQIAAHAPPAR